MKYTNKEEFEKANMFGTGVPNTGFAKYFIGSSYLSGMATADANQPLNICNVTFEPGCRNNWHIHTSKGKGGQQILLCTAGEGWYVEEGKEPVELKEGVTVVIPANVKHWHGAKKDSWFSHISIGVPGVESENIWLEPVTEEEYNKLKD